MQTKRRLLMCPCCEGVRGVRAGEGASVAELRVGASTHVLETEPGGERGETRACRDVYEQ